MDIYVKTKQINKHFFFKVIDYDDENEKKDDDDLSKISVYNFFSINEVNICELINQIPYYSNNFNILYDYDFISVNQLSDKALEKINSIYIQNNQKYLLFQYKNIKCIKFNEYLFNISTPKIFILNVIESFSYLLNSLIKLNNKNVCFFNLSHKNIVFSLKNGNKPILTDFQKSLQLRKLNDKYISKIIENTDDYTYKPLEVHVLFYLIHNDLQTISYSLIEEICEVYVKNLHILSLFSQNYKESYKLLCVKSLEKYINKTKLEIVNDIIERNQTWDNYSLSVLYIHIIGNISRVFMLKNTFLSRLTIELIKNINPDSSKRENLETTLINYEKLYNEFKDWSFINKIPIKKMEKLFQILSE